MKKIIFLICISLVYNYSTSQSIDWSQKANPSLNSINSVAFKPDGMKVLSGTNCHPASIRIFDVNTSNLEWDYTVGSNYLCIMGVSFSTNSNLIAAIEEFGNIFIFDNSGVSPILVDSIKTGTSYGFSIAISPNSDKIVVGCSDGKMQIYSLFPSNLLHNVNAHPSWVTTVCYSPNGNFVISGGSDDKVKIWDTSGNLLFNCSGHNADITNVKVTKDNKYVVSSSKDKTIKIWDLQTGQLIRTLMGHTGNVNGIDISPDDSKIVSASSDSSCKIWDFSNGNVLATFGVSDSGEINTIAWSPNGNKIVTGNIKSDITLWDYNKILNFTNWDNIELDFEITPNPFKDKIEIHLKNNEQISKIMVFNFIGRNVFHSNKNNIFLDLSLLNNGTYLLILETKSGKMASKKICKF